MIQPIRITWATVLATLALSLGSSLLAQERIELHGKRILILGDSITHNGAYVSFLSYLLQTRQPQLDYDIISIGLGSETVAGTSEADHPFPRPCVHSRLDAALAEIKPELVFACYGMNDGIYHPLGGNRFLAYQKGIEELVAKSRQAGAEVILLTPPLFDAGAKESAIPAGRPNYGYKTPYEGYNNVLRTYGTWIMQTELPVVAKVDLNTPMLEYNRTQQKSDPNFHLSKDGIHPGELGHMIMASAILGALGLEPIGDPRKTLSQLSTDPLFDRIHERRKMRSKGWLEFIGYERGDRVKTDSVDAIEKASREMQLAIDQLRRL